MTVATYPRVLVVGIGGTGGLALGQLKKFLNPKGAAVPANMRLLHIDTVTYQSHGADSLYPAERVSLELRDPQAVLRNPGNAHFKDWFPDGLAIQTLVAGAAQIRPLGRLALHAHVERFIGHLGTTLDALTDRARLAEMPAGTVTDELGSIEVYVLTSLCGGTGSGMFIDVAQLIRDELRDAPNVHVCDLLLPGPFRRLGATARVSPNAYAALKELDYLASLNEAVEVRLGGGRVLRMERSPFDLVYLVVHVDERFDTTTDIEVLAQQMAFLPYLMATTSTLYT